jgi:hypothetical protein
MTYEKNELHKLPLSAMPIAVAELGGSSILSPESPR